MAAQEKPLDVVQLGGDLGAAAFLDGCSQLRLVALLVNYPNGFIITAVQVAAHFFVLIAGYMPAATQAAVVAPHGRPTRLLEDFVSVEQDEPVGLLFRFEQELVVAAGRAENATF